MTSKLTEEQCIQIKENFVSPRKNRLSWSDHHMLLALITSKRSPDPNTRVGACIVDSHNKVLGLGYNGLPKGINNDSISWSRESLDGDPAKTKYPYVIHAEKNAILNTTANLENSILYVTLFPCVDCMQILIQKGIKEIFYLEDKYPETWQVIAAKRMADLVDIFYARHRWQQDQEISTWIQKI